MMPRVDRSAPAPAPAGGGSPPTLTAVGAAEQPREEPRSASDILGRSIRVTLGGQQYVMAVLFIAGNERWRALEERTSEELVARLEAAGNDTRSVIDTLTGQVDIQLDLLYAYDTDGGRREGVLPSRGDLKERIHEDELTAALREVVKAANPKAATALMRIQMDALLTNDSSTPSSSRPPSTGGPRKRSAKH